MTMNIFAAQSITATSNPRTIKSVTGYPSLSTLLSDDDHTDTRSDNSPPKLYFKKLRPDAIVPTKGTPHSAGWDLYLTEDVKIEPSVTALKCPTGIAVQIPRGYYGRIALRSGISLRHNLVTTAGVIDSDYTGEVIVLIAAPTLPATPQVVLKKGERVAQLIIEKIFDGAAEEVTDFPRKDAAHGGFGSTGK